MEEASCHPQSQPELSALRASGCGIADRVGLAPLLAPPRPPHTRAKNPGYVPDWGSALRRLRRAAAADFWASARRRRRLSGRRAADAVYRSLNFQLNSVINI